MDPMGFIKHIIRATGWLSAPRPEARETKEVKETQAATVASPLAGPIRRKTTMVQLGLKNSDPPMELEETFKHRKSLTWSLNP